jgi:hypothetical protein
VIFQDRRCEDSTSGNGFVHRARDRAVGQDNAKKEAVGDTPGEGKCYEIVSTDGGETLERKEDRDEWGS